MRANYKYYNLINIFLYLSFLQVLNEDKAINVFINTRTENYLS